MSYDLMNYSFDNYTIPLINRWNLHYNFDNYIIPVINKWNPKISSIVYTDGFFLTKILQLEIDYLYMYYVSKGNLDIIDVFFLLDKLLRALDHHKIKHLAVYLLGNLSMC